MKKSVTGQQPRVTRQLLEAAQAEAVRRFGADVSVSVTPGGAGVGQHGECVTGPIKERDGHASYLCVRCPPSAGKYSHPYHRVHAWRDQYQVSRPMGVFALVLGSGFSFAEAFDAADAREARQSAPPAPTAAVPLPPAKRPARMPQERRSSTRSTATIPPRRRVTGHQPRRRCQDCGVPIPARTRCNRCALRHWRAAHPTAKRTQDARYRAKRPAHVRALVRARVAQWRKQQKNK